MLVDDAGDDARVRKALRMLDPQWDAARLDLSAVSPETGERIIVNYVNGPSHGGRAVDTRGPRVGTPWGSLPVGERAFELSVEGPVHTIQAPHGSGDSSPG